MKINYVWCSVHGSIIEGSMCLLIIIEIGNLINCYNYNFSLFNDLI